jgi:hypothetical protein
MHSESDEGKYYASADTEDEEERRPPSRRFSSSQLPSPDFSVSSSQDDNNGHRSSNGNVAGQQPQPSQWPLPPKFLGRLVHTFSGASMGKQCCCTHDRKYTPLNILLLLFSEIITFLVVETNRYYSQFRQFYRRTFSPTWGNRSGNVCVSGSKIIDGTCRSRRTIRTVRQKWNSLAVHSMDKRRYVQGIITYYVFYISRTITGMELTGRITDYGQCKNYLKF